MTPRPPYYTAIEDDGTTSCRCPDMRYRGGSWTATDRATGATRRVCKHLGLALAGLYRWTIEKTQPHQ